MWSCRHKGKEINAVHRKLVPLEIDLNPIQTPVSSVSDSSKAAEAIHQRDVLADAIRKAAIKAGIVRADADLSGPNLVMLCDDLANAANTANATNAPSASVAAPIPTLRPSKGQKSIVDIDVEWLLAIANQHGEAEGLESEVKDLQDLFKIVYDQLTPQQRATLMLLPEVRDVVENALGDWNPPPAAQPAEIRDWLIRKAEIHGEDSDPDHEAGDLQDLIRCGWRVLEHDQHHQVVLRASTTLDSGACDPMAQVDDELDDDEVAQACEIFNIPVTSLLNVDHEQTVHVVNAFRLYRSFVSEDAHTVEMRKRAGP